MVSEKQLNQYFQFVKDMLLEEVISEPLIHHAHYVNKNFHSRFGQNNVALYMIIASETCKMSLATCSLLHQSRSHMVIHKIYSKTLAIS